MKNFTICLAGQYFTICPVCDYIREYCKDYIVADDAVHGIGDSATGRETGNVTRCATNGALETPSRFYIANTQSDIDFEREKSAREDIKGAFLSGIFPMPTWRHLQSIARLQTTSYLAIPCFFMDRSLR